MVSLVLLLLGILFVSSHQESNYPTYSAVLVGDKWVEVHDDVPVDKFRPLPPLGRADHDALIFVSIVTYRDSRCVATLHNLFDQAKDPDRIRVGASPVTP
jgi:hypothetical protein